MKYHYILPKDQLLFTSRLVQAQEEEKKEFEVLI
jgi:hypothetical protein